MMLPEPSSTAAHERELHIARRIQAGFLPETLLQPSGWEIAARFQPAQMVGGDFYDVFPLVNNRRVGVVVADVCDKGVGAALFMALFRTLIRAFAQQHTTLRWTDALAGDNLVVGGGRRPLPSIGDSALKNALTLTNAYILENHGASGMFATVFFAVIDPQTGGCSYCNAGHTPPLLIGEGTIRTRLEPTGPALGMLPGVAWEIRQAQIEPGETLLAYTDGVTEARTSDGQFYGEARLETLVCQPVGSAGERNARIEADVRAFAGGAPPSDDITLLSVYRRAIERDS